MVRWIKRISIVLALLLVVIIALLQVVIIFAIVAGGKDTPSFLDLRHMETLVDITQEIDVIVYDSATLRELEYLCLNLPDWRYQIKNALEGLTEATSDEALEVFIQGIETRDQLSQVIEPLCIENGLLRAPKPSSN